MLKIKKLYILVALLFCATSSFAQKINGHVYTTETGEPVGLEGVTVAFPASSKGVMTAAGGAFEIEYTENEPLMLVFSFVGYNTDTVKLTGKPQHIMLEMRKSILLDETQVIGYQKGTYNSQIALLKTETITKVGLTKLACCNLSESFENSASITVGFTDAVSGAKQVQLLGLSSLYGQMLAENIPTMRGLSSTFGWNYVPGTWLESIQISKGASSVVNGYESITGQINLEMKKPQLAEPLFINLYGDLEGRFEANITSALTLSDKWSVGLLAHASAEMQEHDSNDDTFLDVPTSKLINLYNRWTYTGANGVLSQTGLKFLNETRHGGQTKHSADNASMSPIFSSDFINKNFTVENKTGIPVGKKEGSSLGIITNFTHFEQNAQIGKKSFDGQQNSFYGNLIFTSFIGDEHHHKYSAGASFVYDGIKTTYQDSLIFNQTPKTFIDKKETVTGIFGEYTYTPFEKLTAVVGIRGDYNSFYNKMLVTPRANLKYDINKYMIARASVGKGYRSPNVIAENIGLLATSRRISVENIQALNTIESAWNYGGNLSFDFHIWNNREASITLDYFHTEFQNQTIADMERDATTVYFYNLKGRSFADVFQIDLSLSPFKNFDIYAAFRYNNTEITYQDAAGANLFRKEKPLTSRFRGLLNLAYATNLRKWVFDFTTQINGQTRVPSLSGYNAVDEYSPAFPILFAQVTKNTKRFDVYLGAENLLNYKQKNPIIDWQNPFNQDFDSSRIWGPLMGRRIYLGARIRIGELK
jgi:hypothetical protein